MSTIDLTTREFAERYGWKHRTVLYACRRHVEDGVALPAPAVGVRRIGLRKYAITVEDPARA